MNIRCSIKGCRRLLLAVEKWPNPDSDLWTGDAYGVWAEGCPKHREIRPRELIAEADARRTSKGLPPLDRRALMVYVTWAALRPAYLDATHRGRAVDHLAP